MKAERYRELRRLFQLLREVPKERREALLDAERPDSELRSELLAMLDGPGGLPTVELGAVHELLDDVAVAGPEASVDRFGPFELIRCLGQGGMGTVHLAIDTRLDRRVALKQIRPELLHSERSRQRFEREAKALSRLDHPHLCAIHDVGRCDDVPFIVMPFYEGTGLREYAPEHSARALVALFEKLARALQVAHAAGLVHRDIKPDNILVRSDGEPVLLDFGLARDVESDRSISLTNEQVGTPAYMAPECIDSEREVDSRADVYSLGASLYEAATGTPPFQAARQYELLSRIVRDTPVAAHRLGRRVSRDLSIVIATAMEKDPDRRYRTAQAFADDLGRILDGRDVLARPPSFARRVVGHARRHPARALAVLLAAIVLVAVTVIGARYADVVQSADRAARLLETGDVVSARRALADVPQWLDGLVLEPGLLALRGLAGSGAFDEVVRTIETDGVAAGWLLAARYCERDGPQAHPRLSRMLEFAIREPAQRAIGLPLVGRLFFDRLDEDRTDVETDRLRRAIEAQDVATLAPEERLFALTALSGCGQWGTIGTIGAWIEATGRDATSPAQLAERRELVRLAIVTVETLIRRFWKQPNADTWRARLDSLTPVAWIAARAVNPVVGSARAVDAQRVLNDLFVTIACARRSAGLHPLGVPTRVGSDHTSLIVRAARRDRGLLERVRSSPSGVYTELGGEGFGRATRWWSFVLVMLGEIDDPTDAVARTEALTHEFDELDVSRSRTGAREARQILAGIRTGYTPDADTHLGALLGRSVGWDVPSLRVAPSQAADLVAGWDLSQEPVLVADARQTLSWSGVTEVKDEYSNALTRRLGCDGASSMSVSFVSGTPGNLSLEIRAQKAKRALLLDHGRAWLAVSLDGSLVGSIGARSTTHDPPQLTIPLGLVEAGSHELAIELTLESNTTVRIVDVTVRSMK